MASAAIYLESLITPERNTATGLVIAPPVCKNQRIFSHKTPKKHQNGHLPGVNITIRNPLLLTQEVQEVKVYT
jgi:hypothetical protein